MHASYFWNGPTKGADWPFPDQSSGVNTAVRNCSVCFCFDFVAMCLCLHFGWSCALTPPPHPQFLSLFHCPSSLWAHLCLLWCGNLSPACLPDVSPCLATLYHRFIFAICLRIFWFFCFFQPVAVYWFVGNPLRNDWNLCETALSASGSFPHRRPQNCVASSLDQACCTIC